MCVIWMCFSTGLLVFGRAVVYYLYDFVFFFQAEDGIRDLVRSRGLGDVYKRQAHPRAAGSVADRPGGGRCRLGRDRSADVA